ncbi:hypothetical protein B7R21_18385 [Subtercola boreus]|uniref:Uncharacterized protein n=1 Tax=Subtercola boreus TaxID=120213 RepID=A0A3E0VAE2_9MICO|nr:hypothetical protein B7R21_18385 [Subtercola boreus]
MIWISSNLLAGKRRGFELRNFEWPVVSATGPSFLSDLVDGQLLQLRTDLKDGKTSAFGEISFEKTFEVERKRDAAGSGSGGDFVPDVRRNAGLQ